MEALTRVVVEVLDSHDRVQARERLTLETGNNRFTVGRGVAADVMIDDVHAAALHAAIELGADGKWRITDLESVNGVVVGGARHRGAVAMALPEGTFRIGNTRLRVRGEHEALAPERPDRGDADIFSGRVGLVAIVGAVVCAVCFSYLSWLAAPRDAATVVAVGLVSFFVTTAVWVAIWALLTRVMRGEARWIVHAAIALGVVAAVAAVDWVITLGWFAFTLPQFPWYNTLFGMAAAMLLLYWHISAAARVSQRTALLIAVAVPLLIIGTMSWVEARKQARNVNYIGEPAQLFPPALRLRQGKTLDVFFERAAGMKNEADQKRKAVESDDSGEASSADDDD